MLKNLNVSKLANLYFFTLLLLTFSLNTVFANPSSTNSGDAGAFMALFVFGFYALCCLVILIPQIAFAIWVYKDAKKLNVDNPILWAILSFMFFPLLTIVYYMVIRKEAKQKLEKNNVN